MSQPLLPWHSEPDNPQLVWRCKLDNRYLIEVRRVNDDSYCDGYRGELCIFDHDKDDLEIAYWNVGLSYGATFGPDVADIDEWEEKVQKFIDNDYGKKPIEEIMVHFVSASCRGEYCSICKAPATHKVGEEIASDDPNPVRHNLIAYVYCEHFRLILGPTVSCPASASARA